MAILDLQEIMIEGIEVIMIGGMTTDGEANRSTRRIAGTGAVAVVVRLGARIEGAVQAETEIEGGSMIDTRMPAV